MRFTLLFTVGASLFAAVAAIPTATQIADALHDISVKQSNLIEHAKQITIINAPLFIVGHGPFPTIIAGVTDVWTRIQFLAGELQNVGTFNAEGKAAVVNAYLKFSQSQMGLVTVINAKATIIDKVPVVGVPVKAMLQKLEVFNDALAIALIQHVEEPSVIESQANAMSRLLDETIRKYASFVFGDLNL